MSAVGEVIDLEGRRAPRRQRHVEASIGVITCAEMKGCSFAARLLYVVLTTFLDYRTGDGWASWGDLADAMGTSRGRVRALGAELEAAGLVARYSRGKTRKGEDFACGWRLLRPESLVVAGEGEAVVEVEARVEATSARMAPVVALSPGAVDGPEPRITPEHTYAHGRAHPCPPAGPDRLPDRSPDRSRTQVPHTAACAADARALVCAFHRTRGVEDPRPSPTELRFAAGLVMEHGVTGARAVAGYALGRIQKSWPEAATFNAVKVFAAEAVSAGVVERARAEEARAVVREAEERKLDRSCEPPEECLAELEEQFGEEWVRTSSIAEKWEFLRYGTILEDYLDRRCREVERECGRGTA